MVDARRIIRPEPHAPSLNFFLPNENQTDLDEGFLMPGSNRDAFPRPDMIGNIHDEKAADAKNAFRFNPGGPVEFSIVIAPLQLSGVVVA